MIDFQVRFFCFHNQKIKEAVTQNEDGTYTIFIEETLCEEKRKEVCLHALQHILDEDFQKSDANLIEEETHSKSFEDSLYRICNKDSDCYIAFRLIDDKGA